MLRKRIDTIMEQVGSYSIERTFLDSNSSTDKVQLWRGEWDSNPRVLSNMGLAIPRPTRLGDPRSYIRTRFNGYINNRI
jgi:hypothetical protein